MKRRIRGDSIRLRLKRAEVDWIGPAPTPCLYMASRKSPMRKYNYAFSASGLSRRKDSSFSQLENPNGPRVSHRHDCRRGRSLVHRVDATSNRNG